MKEWKSSAAQVVGKQERGGKTQFLAGAGVGRLGVEGSQVCPLRGGEEDRFILPSTPA